MNFSMTEAHKKTGYLKSPDQISLFYRYYAVENMKAMVLLVHGFGEHGGRYKHVIKALQQAGYAVFSVDFRGHGHSQGPRGDIEAFQNYEDDIRAALGYVQKIISPGKKIFVLAHSLGGLVSLRLAAKGVLPVDGMVLSCPLIALKMAVPFWKKWASIFAASFIPKARVSTGIKGQHLSKERQFAEAYDHDPLVLKNLSARTFYEIYQGCLSAQELAKKAPQALLMQLGGDDPVVDTEASEQWFSKVDKDKVDATIKIYEGLLHEIYNEVEREKAIADMVAWLNQRS